MKKYLLACGLFSVLFVSGCSGLAVMKQVERIEDPDDGRALVNFVRPRIFLGDGVKYEVWDGANFVGTLAAGRMIQHQVLPGEHIFMIDPTQAGVWGYQNLYAEEGKTYYLKPNNSFIGLRIGVASPSDPRIPDWNNDLEPMAVDASKSKPVPERIIKKVEGHAKKFKSL